MTVTTRSAALAATFERGNAEALELLSGCTVEQWQRTTLAEGWTVAAAAHHLATVQQAFVGIVEKFAAGETYSPTINMEEIHRNNAKHASAFADADKIETLDILRSSGVEMAGLIGSFDDPGLDRVAGDFGGNEMTVARFIEYVVIGHSREHATSIQNTIAG
jgi:DinB superfamily